LDDRGSFAWIAHPQEGTLRASSAVAVPGGCLVVDPVDAPGLDEAIERLGRPVGIATLLDRHQRDAAAVAARLDVPRITPRVLGGPGVTIEGVEERTVVARRGWREALLWVPDRRLLVCPETIGTGPFFLAREGDRLGVHPLARLIRVRPAFAGLEPERIAVGHGAPLLAGAAEALETALAHPLRDLPRAWVRATRIAARWGRAG
jgi:hypothetical protein